jgi:hypothetical protein
MEKLKIQRKFGNSNELRKKEKHKEDVMNKNEWVGKGKSKRKIRNKLISVL